MTFDKTFCANHRTCGNTDCLRKPTAAEIASMQDRKLQNIAWGDYHHPTYGVRCQFHKPVEYDYASA